MKQDSSRDIERDGRGSASTEALAESRTSLSEWQTDPELKFYRRAMSSTTSKRLAGQRASVARAAADDQELARALRAPEQVGEGPGVAAVAAVAQNHPAALIRNPYLSSEH